VGRGRGGFVFIRKKLFTCAQILSGVILSLLTMRQLEKMSWNSPAKFPADAAGCLYDPRVRELMRQFGAHVPQAPAEAFSALRLAA